MFDRELAVERTMSVLMVNDPPPVGYRHTAEAIVDLVAETPIAVTDQMVERAHDAYWTSAPRDARYYEMGESRMRAALEAALNPPQE